MAVLDGVRATAVLAIYLRHSWGLSGSPAVKIGSLDLSPLIVMMASGVDLFFVLSGYLLARPFLRSALSGTPRPRLSRYFTARAHRLLPGYYVAFAFVVLVFAPMLLKPIDVYSLGGFETVLSHLFLVQTMNPVSYGRWGIASPYWTLTIEVVFYMALPFAVRAFTKRRLWLGLALGGLISLAWLYLARNHLSPLLGPLARFSRRAGAGDEYIRFFLSKQLPGYAFTFACGIFVAAVDTIARHRIERDGRQPWWWGRAQGHVLLIGGLCWLFAASMALGRLTLDGAFYDGVGLMATRTSRAAVFYYGESPWMAVGFAALILGAIQLPSDLLTAPLRWAPVRAVGMLGYGVYLWHMPFLYLYNHIAPIATLPPGWHWFWLSTAAAVPAAALALASFLVIEKPWVLRHRPAILSTTETAK